MRDASGRDLTRRALLGLSGSGLAVYLTGCSTSSEPTGPTTSPTSTSPPTATRSSAGPTQTSRATTAPSAGEALPSGPVNALLIGSDSRVEGVLAGHSDTIVVVQLSADRSHLNLVSIARDSAVAYPSGGRGKINAIYASGGPKALAQAVSGLLGGLPIHCVVETGFRWFVEISHLLEGYSVTNQHRSSSSGVAFPAGRVWLKGQDALTYVRERKGLPAGDLDRTERHRAALTGMLARMAEIAATDVDHVWLLTHLFRRVRSVGFTLGQARAMLPLVRTLGTASVTSVMVPVARFDSIGGASVDILNQTRTAELAIALRAGDLSGYVARYGTSSALTG